MPKKRNGGPRRDPRLPLPPIDQPESAFSSRKAWQSARARAAGYSSYSAWLKARREAGVPPGPGGRAPRTRERVDPDTPRLTRAMRLRLEADPERWRGASYEELRRGVESDRPHWTAVGTRETTAAQVLDADVRHLQSRVRLVEAQGLIDRDTRIEALGHVEALRQYMIGFNTGVFPGPGDKLAWQARFTESLHWLIEAGILDPESDVTYSFFYHHTA